MACGGNTITQIIKIVSMRQNADGGNGQGAITGFGICS